MPWLRVFLCLFFRHDFFDLIVIQIIMRPPPWPSAFHLQPALFVNQKANTTRAVREEGMVWPVKAITLWTNFIPEWKP